MRPPIDPPGARPCEPTSLSTAAGLGGASAHRRGSAAIVAIVVTGVVAVVAIAGGTVMWVTRGGARSSVAAATPTPTTTPAGAHTSTSVRPTTTTPRAAATTRAITVRSVDFKNFVYELACFGAGLHRVRVTNGTWADPRGPEWGAVNAVTVSYGHATGTGTQDALVQVDCSVGAGTEVPETLVYSVVHGQLTKIGDIPGSGRFGNSPGTIIVDTPHPAPTDPMCCPSEYESTTYSYDGRIFVSSNNELVPATTTTPTSAPATSAAAP